VDETKLKNLFVEKNLGALNQGRRK
jgi:hypothetical protein